MTMESIDGHLLCRRYSLVDRLHMPSLADSKAAVLFDDSEIVSKEYRSWFKPSFMDLRDDLAEARDGGKQGLMLLFDTEGCAYCKAFQKHTLSDPMIQADVRANFDVVRLGMFERRRSYRLFGAYVDSEGVLNG